MATEELVGDLAMLEAQHKKTGSKQVKVELDAMTNKYKLLDATRAAKEAMYARQQSFEYRDKSSKQLALILEEARHKQTMVEAMIASKGKEIRAVMEKVQMFSDYYNELYESSRLNRKRF